MAGLVAFIFGFLVIFGFFWLDRHQSVSALSKKRKELQEKRYALMEEEELKKIEKELDELEKALSKNTDEQNKE